MFLTLCFFIPNIFSASERYEAELESTTRWEPMRILFDIVIDDPEKKLIIEQTTDSIRSYLSQLLKVHPCKYIKTFKTDDFEEKTYNNIDFYCLIKSLPPGDEAAASTQPYVDRKNDYRPKASLIKVALPNIVKASTINDNPRDLFEILIHEVFHALGVSQGMFQYWIEPESGQQYIYLQKNPTYNCSFEGIKRDFTFVTTKNIKEFVKRKYGDDDFGIMPNGQICEAGIELEDDGGEGSKGKHPELRVFPYEIMGAFHKSGKIHSISDLTLTLLNSSGYYQVNFSLAEPYSFGYPETNDGKPIKNFMVGKPSETWPENYQCNPERYNIVETATSFQVCHPDLRSIAQCSRHKYNCPRPDTEICDNVDFIDPSNTGYSGTSQDTDYIAFPEPIRACTQPLLEDLEFTRYGSTVGDSSICLVSNVRNKESGWYNPEMLVGRCFNIECDDKFSQYTVTLADGSEGICREKGQNLTFPEGRYKFGHIECGDPYWTCFAMNNKRHSFDYVPPPPPPTDDDTGDDTQSSEISESIPDSSEKVTMPPVVTVTLEPTPTPNPGPSVDSTFTTTGDKITLTKDGYKDNGGEEKLTKNSKGDVILIKFDGFKFSVSADTENEPSQNKFISPQTEGATITVIQPKNNDFGKGQIGIHGNEMDPTINIATARVPLNFYSNEINTIRLVILEQLPGDDETVDKQDDQTEEIDRIFVRNVLSQNGQFLLNVPLGVTHVEYNEIDVFNNAVIDSVSGVFNNNPINSVVDKMNLNEGSTTKITRLEIKSQLLAKKNAKISIDGHATFGSECVILLSHLSFIDLGSATVDGVCKSLSINLDSVDNLNLLDNEEENMICGENFICKDWITKFSPNDVYKEAKCENTTDGKQCLIAVRKSDESGSGGNNKNNKKTIIIVVVVVVVVVVIAAVVVAVILIMKKKKSQESDALAETNANNTENDMGI